MRKTSSFLGEFVVYYIETGIRTKQRSHRRYVVGDETEEVQYERITFRGQNAPFF